MHALKAIKAVAEGTGTPLSHIGLKLGKAGNYVNTMIKDGSTPRCDVMANMLSVCGYKLCAVKDTTELPIGAFVITDEEPEREKRKR